MLISVIGISAKSHIGAPLVISDSSTACLIEYWKEKLSFSPGSALVPHSSHIIPLIIQLGQKIKCTPPTFLQFTVAWLYPTFETFSGSDTSAYEDNVTSVVMLIRTLLVR